MGASLPELLEQAGGTSGRPRAVLLGGFHGSWVRGAEVADLALDAGSLTPYGASLAAGVVFVLGEHACPVREVATVLRWLAAESAGQCGPCRSGLPAIAAELTRVADGGGRIELLRRWCRQLPGRGVCRLPDGAVRFLVSALELFDAELADPARYGPCETCARPTEILPPSDAGRAAA
jgi:NADH:ubiquinone oxidoreductase subunit F (NADH-binding)